MAARRFRIYSGVQPFNGFVLTAGSSIMASAPTVSPHSVVRSGLAFPVGRLAGIGLVIFMANAALLVLQLVANRLLAPFIGSSLETWTSIIGVFLLGIAIGNAYGGRLADRYPSPRTLAAVLGAGALAALWMALYPMLLSSTGLYKMLPLGPRIPLLALSLCLPSGFVLSLLTPLSIKLGLPDVSTTGRVAGMVFALSTLGCLIGNYITGFVLIPAFTINILVYSAAIVLAVLAAGTMFLLQDPQVAAGDSARWMSDAIPQSSNPHAFSDIRHAFLIVFLASFGGMTLELTASRVLAQYVGVSLFTWTGIIGVMLAGTALGNFTGGVLADAASQPGAMRGPLAWLASLCVFALVFGLVDKILPWGTSALGYVLPLEGRSLLAVAVVLSLAGAFAAYQGVVRLARDVINPRLVLGGTLIAAGAATVFILIQIRVFTFALWSADGWLADQDLIMQVVVMSFAMFFFPMFVLGMISPQVIRLAVPDVAHVGRVAGRVYAWSTAGAIAGTFAAGYILLSHLGMDRTILVVALMLTVTSLIVMRVWERNIMLYAFSIVLGTVTGGFLLTLVNQSIGQVENGERLIAREETNYYTIVVKEELDDTGHTTTIRKLHLDALLHSTVDLSDPRYLGYEHEHIQVDFLWAVPADSPRALVIGGGGYTFQRCAMELLPKTRMDVVEIDPGVTRVAYQYLGLKPYNGLNIFHMDGRQFVAERAAPAGYDLVIQDAVNDLSVPAHLLTREYNDAVKRTLAPKGVYLLTVIDSIKYGRLWRSAMRTLGESFPHVELIASGAVPPAEQPAGASEDRLARWKREKRHFDEDRQVLVIYASDEPLDEGHIRAQAYRQMDFPARAFKGAAIGQAVGGGVGACRGVIEMGLDYTAFYTSRISTERLRPFLEADPGILLTDQFAPVDNLMAEVFRYRNRKRPDQE